MCVCVYVCVCVRVCVCLCVCMSVWGVYICVEYVCLHVYVCTCLYVCVCIMSVHVCLNHDIQYMGQFWCGKNLANLANHELFAKIFLINIHRYTKMYLAYVLTVAYSSHFFLTNSFYL